MKLGASLNRGRNRNTGQKKLVSFVNRGRKTRTKARAGAGTRSYRELRGTQIGNCGRKDLGWENRAGDTSPRNLRNTYILSTARLNWENSPNLSFLFTTLIVELCGICDNCQGIHYFWGRYAVFLRNVTEEANRTRLYTQYKEGNKTESFLLIITFFQHILFL